MTIDPVALLRLEGPLSAGRLVERLGVSRPTLSRAVRAAGDRIVVRGRARGTGYAARRALRGSMAPLPLFRIDRTGTPHRIAEIDPIHPGGVALAFDGDPGWPLDPSMRAGWFEGLPYPMQDMRPQGFLGRNFARHHAAMLQVAEDPTHWSDDDVLHVLSILGDDTPGDLLVGTPACLLWLRHVRDTATGRAPAGLPAARLAEAYPRLASEALALGVAGASAGGEFPKFTALRQRDDGTPQHVLVKFSGSDDAPGTRRWADLLVCEHLAGRALDDHLGIACARTQIHRHARRTFLEVERFDRHGALGRSGVVSWQALNHAFVGAAGRPWAQAVQPMVRQGWVAPADADRILRIGLFGQLIGNTDMHDGNLSFLTASPAGDAPLCLAPVYDMLPMAYAPVRGVELPERAYAPRLPLPAEAPAWREAAQAALHFWERAADDERISDGFRRTCADNAMLLRTLASR